jgi:regulatory protein
MGGPTDAKVPSNTGETRPDAEMARVTAIEPQRRADRVSIFLDGEFAVGVHQDVATALGVRIGREIALADLEALVRAETRRRAMEACFRLLSYRARSRDELKRRLERRQVDSAIIDEVLTELGRLGMIDDELFARAYVDGRSGARPMGRQRIAWELRQKGVAAETIREALEAREEPEQELGLAMTAGRQIVRRLGREEPAVARRRLAAALQRRGFGWSVVAVVLDQLLPEDAD